MWSRNLPELALAPPLGVGVGVALALAVALAVALAAAGGSCWHGGKDLDLSRTGVLIYQAAA